MIWDFFSATAADCTLFMTNFSKYYADCGNIWIFQMSAHKQRYKNAGLDSSEMRRRREEEGIQLRKQKREQQLIKRRNVDSFQTMDNELENTLSVTIICERACREFIANTNTYQ